MNSSVRVGSLGPLTVVRAGCELERSERSSSAERGGMPHRQRGAEQLGGERLEQMLTAADLGESSQCGASRSADAVRSFAPAPFQDGMAIVVARVTPAAASEVAA